MADKTSEGWIGDPLSYLLAPVPAAAFFSDYYEQAPLLVARDEPERYSAMLTVEDVDAFIDGADLRQGMLDLVRASGRIDGGRYLSSDGRVIASAVADEYLKGATIILPQLHESMPVLGAFCRAIEGVFSCHVQTNIYLTPPSNQGFATHYDNHDVFVLQLSGSKSWRLYGTPIAIPYRGEGFVSGQHDPGEISASLTLNPGDCLYLPRGVMHDAPNAGDMPSLHVTVGLITKTWADLVLEAVSELALREPAFRRSLPPGYAQQGFDRADARQHFDQLKRIIADQANMDEAFNLLAHNFLRERRPSVRGVIVAGPPGEGEKFRRREVVPWQLADGGSSLVLVGPAGDLQFDADDANALERALSGVPFRLADLDCKDPQRVLRKLWAHGYLERAAHQF